MSSHELSEWMALASVEAQERAERLDDPEGWQQREQDAYAALRRDGPGILVRIQEDEPDEVPSDDDGAPE